MNLLAGKNKNRLLSKAVVSQSLIYNTRYSSSQTNLLHTVFVPL